jgi:hypothetical protein
MNARSSAARAAAAASVRDWVESTLNSDELHALTRSQIPFRPLESVYDSSRDLKSGLAITELDAIPEEFFDVFK